MHPAPFAVIDAEVVPATFLAVCSDHNAIGAAHRVLSFGVAYHAVVEPGCCESIVCFPLVAAELSDCDDLELFEELFDEENPKGKRISTSSSSEVIP